MKNICVIGGGASGIIAAIEAGKDAKVTIFEKKEQLGKKLSVTGNGKCNLINDDQSFKHFHSKSSELAEQILSHISKDELLQELSDKGILTYERNGYHYPLSDQAQVVVKLLTDSLDNTEIRLSETVKYITKDFNVFTVKTDKGNYKFDKVILSVGTPAGLSIKESYNGTEIIRSLAHTVLPFKPALCGLLSEDKITKYWAGVRTEANISIYNREGKLSSERGELMLSADGISGIAAYQLSHFVDKNNYVLIDFLPTLSVKEITEFLCKQRDLTPERTVTKGLYGLLNTKLAESLLTEATFKVASVKGYKSYNLLLKELDDNKISDLAIFLKTFKVNITGTRDYKDSQVCSGGVPLSEINTESCESRLVPGLYLTGELLDMAGDCGGYNLQWAFTTGLLAGRSARK